MDIQIITPQFGVNYDTGYIGFTYTGGFVAAGVAYFERWNRLSDIKVTHALIVSGENECIEAHIDEGVARVSLAKYFADPQCRIFFRKPRGWNPGLGQRIAAAAAAKVGDRYNTGLVVAEGVADTVAGRWMNKLFHEWPHRVLNRWLARPNEFICSELAAYALAQQPEFAGLGVLAKPLDTIDPQELFEDTELFEDWVNESGPEQEPQSSIAE
jgi:hypothetical protein